MNLHCSVTVIVPFVLLKISILHSRCKHIELKYHFIRNLINDGDLILLNILGAENLDDMLTKTVTTTKLRLCIASTGLREN